MSSLIVRTALPEDTPKVFALLVACGWGQRLASEQALRELLAASQIKVVALLDGEIVGFTRAITDGLSNGHLSMVAVAQAHRRTGIGKALVQHVVADSAGITWVLRAGRPNAQAFFSSLGFSVSSEAMELKRSAARFKERERR